MNINQLEYFIKLAEIQHVSEAAELLNISQPALSKTISRLERELNANLFDRTGRNIYLNENGKLFLSYAKTAVASIEHGKIVLKKNTALDRQIIIQSMPMSIFPGLLDKLLSCYQNIKMVDVHVPVIEQKNNLLSGVTDICFTNKQFHSDELCQKLVSQSKLILTVPADHKLAKYITIKNTTLLNERFITSHERSPIYEHNRLVFGNHLQDISTSFREVSVINPDDILYYVYNKQGLAILSETVFNVLMERFPYDIATITLLDEFDKPYITSFYTYRRKENIPQFVLDVNNTIVKYFKTRNASSTT